MKTKVAWTRVVVIQVVRRGDIGNELEGRAEKTSCLFVLGFLSTQERRHHVLTKSKLYKTDFPSLVKL